MGQYPLIKANNNIDFDSITDVIITLNYTAFQGGETLKKAITTNLPSFSGMRFLSFTHKLPEKSTIYSNLLLEKFET